MAGTGGSLMQNRRDFVRTMAGASAGFYAAGGRFDLLAQAPAERRQGSLARRRIQGGDVHAHGTVSEVAEVVKGTPYERQGGNQALGGRIALLDKQGIDVQALSINVFWWYEVKDRGLAGQIVRAQNEGLAKWVASHPDRFVALASSSLQFPDLAAEQLEDGVKRLGLRGAAIREPAHAEGLPPPQYNPI